MPKTPFAAPIDASPSQAAARLPLPPLVSGALPLLGHAPHFLRDQLLLLERGYAEHGEVFRLRLGRRPAIFLLGPDYARWVFKKTDDQNLAIGQRGSGAN